MVDFIGLVAGAFVLTTFSMKSMLWLRLAAIASNIAFISYGVLADLLPIYALHALLLPLNIFRLAQYCGYEASFQSVVHWLGEIAKSGGFHTGARQQP